MPGRIAVTIPGRSGCAGFGERPGGGEILPCGTRHQQRVGLGGRPQAIQRGIRHIEQDTARLPRVHDTPAEEISRGTRHRDQCGGDQAAGRGFGDRNRLFALGEKLCDFLANGDQVFHRVYSGNTKTLQRTRCGMSKIKASELGYASYLNESETRVRNATTFPSSTFMSILATSAIRRSRSDLAAVLTACRPASSQEVSLTPTTSTIL